MRTLGLSLFLVLISFGATSSIRRQARNIQVTISVSDQAGTPITGAHIELVPMPDSSVNWDTDAHGELKLKLPPRGYALFVTMPGFKNFATHLDVPAPSNSEFERVTLLIGATGSPTNILPPSAEHALVVDAYPYAQMGWLQPDQLARLPHIELTVRNPRNRAEETYKGVLLSELLSGFNAPLGKAFQSRGIGMCVIAVGTSDAVFSLAELDPAVHPAQVLVADAMNGHTLGVETGPFELVVVEDKTRVRWVSKLHDIMLTSVH